MNAQELITSGLLEAYVLGEGTPQERALVERMAATDPAVKAELDAIEQALEAHAFRNAVQPPVRVRAAVMEAIGAADPQVRALPPLREERSRNWSLMAAAAVVALLFSGAGNFMLYSELRSVRDRLADMESDRTIMAQELQVQRTSLQRSENELAVVVDPAMRMVELKGMNSTPDAKARIYWDPAKRVVHMGPASLPAPPQGMQYQLWAIVDGKPVDAGIMPIAPDDTLIHRMKDVGDAQAFAVTLEKEGGVASPTLSAMVLMGQTGQVPG